jgi:hypothetical protein
MENEQDINFQEFSQKYLKKKSELREAQQRFFEENLNEREIFKAEVNLRQNDNNWKWNQETKSSPKNDLKIEEEVKVNTEDKNEVVSITVPTYEDYLQGLLLGDQGINEEIQIQGKDEVMEPEVIFGKIESYLDYILRSSQNNYNEIQRKKDKLKNDKKNGNKLRKRGKKKVKNNKMIKEESKTHKEILTLDKSKILAKGDILQIGDLLKTSNGKI